MSIVLIHQDKEAENKDNEELQADFKKNDVDTVIVPYGLSVHWLPGIGKGEIAVISIESFSDVRLAQHVRAAEQLKKDLSENDVHAIILPSDTSVEVMPF